MKKKIIYKFRFENDISASLHEAYGDPVWGNPVEDNIGCDKFKYRFPNRNSEDIIEHYFVRTGVYDTNMVNQTLNVGKDPRKYFSDCECITFDTYLREITSVYGILFYKLSENIENGFRLSEHDRTIVDKIVPRILLYADRDKRDGIAAKLNQLISESNEGPTTEIIYL